jgi:hypothetical protein
MAVFCFVQTQSPLWSAPPEALLVSFPIESVDKIRTTLLDVLTYIKRRGFPMLDGNNRSLYDCHCLENWRG